MILHRITGERTFGLWAFLFKVLQSVDLECWAYLVQQLSVHLCFTERPELFVALFHTSSKFC